MSEGVKRVREAWKVSFGFPVILGMLRFRRQVGPLVVPLPFPTVCILRHVIWTFKNQPISQICVNNLVCFLAFLNIALNL